MVLKKLLGSRMTRSLTVVSVLRHAKQAFDRGNNVRAILLLGLAVLAWKWVLIGMAAEGLIGLVRKGGSSASRAT